MSRRYTIHLNVDELLELNRVLLTYGSAPASHTIRGKVAKQVAKAGRDSSSDPLGLIPRNVD